MTDDLRVRFAPSPTGKLHIGGARTALFNWAYARRHGGRFVLRIEDTDRARSTKESEQAILDGLRWLGIDWDEGPEVGGDYGPYYQSERHERHLGVAATLFRAGWAYRSFRGPARDEAGGPEAARGEPTPLDQRPERELSDEECERRIAAGEKPALRFKVPEGRTRFTDLVRGEVEFDNVEVDDWVMVRADGTPTYNFVVVCDDADMAISHVIRGEEHLTNTPKQVLLYRALGLDLPRFAHLPLMLGKDKKKLSKRTGDTNLLDYRDNGYPPEAVLNFLALQGWALDGETDVFSRDELLARFDVADVSKGGSIFDPEKFLWMAGEYVRTTPLETLAERCAPWVVGAGLATEAELGERRDWYLRAVGTAQERIRLYSELPERLGYLFAADDAVEYDAKAAKNARKHEAWDRTLRDYLDWLAPRLEPEVRPDELRDATKAWVGERGIKFPALFQPLRCALTGEPGGPDLFEVMELLGADAVRARIERGIERLAADA